MMEQTKLRGLSAQQVEQSRIEHGENVITPAKKESVWKLFIEKFKDPIIKILLVAACLSLVVSFIDGEFAETIGIFSAIILATGVAFWFEYDAKRRFDVLNAVSDDTMVKVRRDGEVMEIPKRDVVVDDVVLLESGEEIPADGLLVEAVSLKVNESTLTGELMIAKTIDPDKFKLDATYPSNMGLRGTTVVEGHAIMVVTAVGDATELGKVAEQATIQSEEKTPLNVQLDKLSKVIGRIGASLSFLIFFVMLAKGLFFGGDLIGSGWVHITSELLEYFMIAVAMMVMSIPEGLPMSITLSLAMSMRRMLKTNNLVRKMHACETMGAVTVICTDKTGTLTQNQMRVYQMEQYGDEPKSVIDELIAVNSTAFLDNAGKVIGNPTEGALLLWLKDHGVEYGTVRDSAKVVDQMTFTTERKYMATLVAGTDGNVLYVKGAPEIVRAMCAQDGMNDTVNNTLREFQNKAMRTLGFAYCNTNAATCAEAIESGALKFIGIAAISDPVRADVPLAVEHCQNAGINIKIVTGDTPATACEIARQIGLWKADDTMEKNHITGVDFAALTDAELLERVRDLKVMSRARPLDKQRLVKLLQQLGEVVAVTGDGTNDAPALNFAHVGLSMGTGTSVAKDASDITLLDDSFASIATAVMWGRSLYKNIQRFVLFQLTINFAALVVVFFGSIFGNELPLTVTQILWVNLIMDTFAAMALASLPPNPCVMKDKPRKNNDFIINRQMIRSIFGVGMVFIVVLLSMLAYWGEAITPYDLSVFFTVFVMLQFWNLFNAKAFGASGSVFGDIRKCGGFLFILLCILIGQILIVSFGGEVFRVVPITFVDWVKIIGYTALIMVGGELGRLLFGKKDKTCK